MSKEKSLQELFATACRKGDLAAAKKYLAKGASLNKAIRLWPNPGVPPEPPLVMAVSSRNLKLVRFLIEKGTKLSGEGGAKALSWARSPEMARFLISKGVPINASGSDGYTPLNSAIASGDVKRFLLLLELGANPHLMSVGSSPLLHAAGLEVKKAKPIIEALLARGASLEVSNNIGSTPLLIATKNGRIQTAKLLLQKGANPLAKDKEGKTAADFAPTAEFKKFLEGWNPASASKIVVKESYPPIPKRLAAFFKNQEAARYKGFFIAGLPFCTPETRMKVIFGRKELDLFSRVELNRETQPEWLPLCLLDGEEEFLAVKLTSPKCPVALWWHEDGQFYPLAPSLDQFLQRLSPK